jgi:hypothetical protein
MLREIGAFRILRPNEIHRAMRSLVEVGRILLW